MVRGILSGTVLVRAYWKLRTFNHSHFQPTLSQKHLSPSKLLENVCIQCIPSAYHSFCVTTYIWENGLLPAVCIDGAPSCFSTFTGVCATTEDTTCSSGELASVFCFVPYFTAAIWTLYTRSKILGDCNFAFVDLLGKWSGLENLGSMELWRYCALLKSIFENFLLFNCPLLLLIIIFIIIIFLHKKYVFWRKFPWIFRDRRPKWSEIAESIAIFLGNEKKSQDRNFSAILTMPVKSPTVKNPEVMILRRLGAAKSWCREE